MPVQTFIGTCALLISVWLGVSFLRDVPSGRYPVLDKSLSGQSSALAASGDVAARDEPPAPSEP